ncbi:MAG: hypothetical protein QXM96_01450 [Candidatus Woesearchaeota archaeon]
MKKKAQLNNSMLILLGTIILAIVFFLILAFAYKNYLDKTLVSGFN